MTSTPLRIVLEPDLFVIFLLAPQTAAASAVAWAVRNCELALSEQLLDAAGAALNDRRFDKYLSLEQRRDFLARLTDIAYIPASTHNLTNSGFTGLNKALLEAAIAADAALISARDPRLGAQLPIRSVSVIHPDRLIETMTATGIRS
jgi:predicted nucleic acid-binding protein